MAFDAYMRFLEPKVEGEAKLSANYQTDSADGNSGWIDISDYGFSATMAVTPARSGGTGAATTGKGKLEPFNCKKRADATSMSLAFHAAAGTIFKRIVVNLFATLDEGGAKHKPHQFLTVVLQGAVISAYKFSGSAGDDLPEEEISITYGSIEYKYNGFSVDEETGAITPGGKKSVFSWSTIKNSGSKA
ncbi:type VI protein secretion system component Hcp [Ereboglobus sp. PH5-10]|uniref:Hcp family type VI secretion system effector n=1 Tax=Ereboglobus sp. PH5-10 TaxID=2940629 RepID=UPI002404EBD3|nr:type VI secretion system tube protein Hcp [Ereboglobus sp. PH5-10]MDF9826553.1 type VI protein secretion system component Hcp [Ereboglobus sp. PH5-10]